MLRYQRSILWIVVVCVVMAVAAAVCLLTDPVSAKSPDPEDDQPPAAGAQSPEPSPLPTPSPAPQPTPAPAAQFPVMEPWMEAVLRGERAFRRMYGDGGDFTIHELCSFFYGDPSEVQITITAGKFALLDLDGDGQNELVVLPESLYDIVGYLILRQQGDEIAAFAPGRRSIGDLKSDGTFHWSSSAFNNGTGRARFDGGGFAVEKIHWFEMNNEQEIGRASCRERV